MDRIVARLDDRFRVLNRGPRPAVARHRTLLASVDWSRELLEPAERVLLRRLGVFVGGFTAEAAESVTGFPPLDTEGRDVRQGGDEPRVGYVGPQGRSTPTAGRYFVRCGREVAADQG